MTHATRKYMELESAPPSPDYADAPPGNPSTVEAEIPVYKPGAQYAPGTYPTPELLPYPTGRYRVLNDTRSFTSITIQSALDSLGGYSTLYLPQGSRWAVSSAISLQSHQELATWGYPTDEGLMALLKAESTCKPHVLRCDGTKDVRIRNLRIEGGRERFGYDKGCSSMVHLGGAGGESQTLDSCIVRHPRNWTCCQAFEGAINIRVTNNLIGPSGHSEEVEPGYKWAHGISCASSSGLIAGNLILDATYGAIVLYGAPGTLVTSNLVVAQNCDAIVGIEMSELEADPGNLEWTRVVHNTICVRGAHLKIGIAQGYGVVWKSNTERISSGGTVMYNLIESKPLRAGSPGAISFGYAVANVKSWTCIGNVSAPGVIYRGVYPETNSDLGVATNDRPLPTPFVKLAEVNVDRTNHTTTLHNNFQSDFVEGAVTGLVDITPSR